MVEKKNASLDGVLRLPYEKPFTEIIQVKAERLLIPHSWNGDVSEPEDDIPISEGDPDGNGKGAKGFNEGNNIWD